MLRRRAAEPLAPGPWRKAEAVRLPGPPLGLGGSCSSGVRSRAVSSQDTPSCSPAFVAERNLFRAAVNRSPAVAQKGAHGGNWFPP